ncbi:hypothetical protein BCR33DRAFT_844974 [Rhizoclosmatium globosum]|uniref:Galactose-binding like protein n=1 Tax=Rhizoclosmatium globosum TaxID=329046 RepID=A0A1Y2D353_9FUNG|nr:hypothetical protein BCR33DRAFT_844974 [Rhizoclosmatium globosum]|eukprot:ORY53712.1 hypothetical protein BCR33DRAFT_844974 [Rhizoclosmatium globosum]
MASGAPSSENIQNLRISMVTSADARFPAENMLDGTTKSFWASTGLYPQEFIVTLPSLHVIKKITIWSMKVAGWTISRSGSEKQFDFDEVYSEDIEDTPDQTLQITSFTVSYSDAHRAAAAKHIKFTIRKGYLDFYRVSGTAERRKSRKSAVSGRDEGSEEEEDEEEQEEQDNERVVVQVKERD